MNQIIKIEKRIKSTMAIKSPREMLHFGSLIELCRIREVRNMSDTISLCRLEPTFSPFILSQLSILPLLLI
ncbi:hypothetical protein BpHYR1_027352 [Brachionus plicatilis]|uniref:Uncharacterized protein n=1 Tax=Brachionus plicatilis TaxID=10195 RepID=A0A3M7PXP9_BRAPC|nr:hypothetical protein BpHYR1_027352 [Brachionus plicatilis]